MKIFATRVWGFRPDTWPVITFGSDGHRSKLLRESRAGDKIIFIGTQTEQTQIHEQGKILGMAEIGRSPVKTLDVVPAERRSPDDLDINGNFKWPSGLLMLKAWKFSPQPYLLQVISKQLPYSATFQAVEISNPRDVAAILALHADEIELPPNAANSSAARLDEALQNNKRSYGPVPSDRSSTSTISTDQETFTYAFKLGKTMAWKIGRTVDIVERLKQVNQHIPLSILGHHWTAIYRQSWPNMQRAHEMEQRVLDLLESSTIGGEMVKCSDEELRGAWLKAIGG